MDEAKSLFHMSISAMFAAMLLGAISAIIGVSYLMWSYFARQDAANAKMTQYSNMTAFDNTTLRGSEVESLLTYADKLGVYVVFYDCTGTQAVFNNQSSVSNIKYYYANSRDSAYNIITSKPTQSNSITVCQKAIDALCTENNVNKGIGTGSDKYPASRLNSTLNLCGKSHAQLVQFLTDKTKLGDPVTNGNYGVFKSVLVYSGDTSGDVVGIILIRASAAVTDHCWD